MPLSPVEKKVPKVRKNAGDLLIDSNRSTTCTLQFMEVGLASSKATHCGNTERVLYISFKYSVGISFTI